MVTDILIYETGNGGDAKFSGTDYLVTEGYENLPYLAMFSGVGWWGDDLLLADEHESIKFYSATEKALQTVALTSAGRITIENAIKKDLQFISENIPDTTVEVAATIASNNRLEVFIKINGKQFLLSWNPETKLITYSA